jgi:hypothetical protein
MIVRTAAYIVRDKHTFKTFPELDSKTSARTHFALADPAKIKPRLFATHVSAQETLKQWLKGKRIGARVVPVPERKSDQMEIVPVAVALEW